MLFDGESESSMDWNEVLGINCLEVRFVTGIVNAPLGLQVSSVSLLFLKRRDN